MELLNYTFINYINKNIINQRVNSCVIQRNKSVN